MSAPFGEIMSFDSPPPYGRKLRPGAKIVPPKCMSMLLWAVNKKTRPGYENKPPPHKGKCDSECIRASGERMAQRAAELGHDESDDYTVPRNKRR